MNKASTGHSSKIRVREGFPALRKSHCAQASFAVELKRLRAMSIEERVLEALGLHNRFSWIDPIPKDR
jgi:hypothetical protein